MKCISSTIDRLKCGSDLAYLSFFGSDIGGKVYIDSETYWIY